MHEIQETLAGTPHNSGPVVWLAPKEAFYGPLAYLATSSQSALLL